MGIAAWSQDSSDAIYDLLAGSANIGCDHRHSGGHCFERSVRTAGWLGDHHEEIEAREEVARVREFAAPLHRQVARLSPKLARVRLKTALLSAGDAQRETRQTRRGDANSFEQIADAFGR